MSTLILINVNDGDLLNKCLQNIQLALFSLKLPIEQLFNFDTLYETRTRGKISWAEIDLLTLVNIPTLCFVYIVRSLDLDHLDLLLFL